MPRAEPPQTCEQLEAEWPTILRAVDATSEASDELAALRAWLDKASAALSSVSAEDSSGNRVLALMRDALAMVEALKEAAFSDTSRESNSPFVSIEEEMHGQWAIGVERSMRLFEDKLELWARAIEAEREADQERQRRLAASHQALSLSLPATSDQEALAMTLSRDAQREQEELQLALALSESEAATPPPPPPAATLQTDLREPLMVVNATVVAPPAGDVGFFGRWCRRLTPSCLRRRREEPAAAVPTIAAHTGPGALRPA